MARIIELPQASIITGPENIPFDLLNSTKRFTASQLAAFSAGIYDMPISWDFPTAILNAGLALQEDYTFGTAASGPLAMRSISDLSGFWNPQSSSVGIAVQNAEIERFMSFNSVNHFFDTNSLNLTAALETPGITADVISVQTTGPVSNSTVIPLNSVAGINPLMMYSSSAVTQTASNFRVVSVDPVGLTVTLSLPVTLPINANVRFLPFYIVPTVQAGSNISNLIFPLNNVPPQVVPGMFYANFNDGYSQGSGTRRVVSTTPGSIQLDGTVNVTQAAFLYFQPPITSGQICSKKSYAPGFNGQSIIAFELTCQIPTSPTFGAWPAFWLYPFTGGNGDEIDWFEFFICQTANAGAYTSNLHFGAYQFNQFMRSVGSGNSHWNSGFYRPGTDYSLAYHKFQGIWTKDAVYRFIDNVFTIKTDWISTSLTPSQLIFDLACGSTLAAFLQIYLYPQLTSQFPYSYKLQEVKTWAI